MRRFRQSSSKKKAATPAEVWTLGGLRAKLGLTQTEVAEALGTRTQQWVLKIERASDPRLSTVAGYVRAVGEAVGVDAHCLIVARLDGVDHEIVFPIRELKDEPGPQEETMAVAETRSAPPAGHGRAWRLRAWDDLGIEQAWLDGGFVSMSDDELGDLSDFPPPSELARRLRRALAARHDHREQKAIETFIRYWRMFRIDMTPGDVVAVPLSGRRVAIGEITGEYEYVADEPDTKLRHRRSVRWLTVSMPRANLADDLRGVVNAPGTICTFRATDAACRLHPGGG